MNLLKSFLLGSTLSLTSCAHATYPVSDHYDGKKFFVPGVQIDKKFSDLLKWQWEGGKAEWPDWLDDRVKPNISTATNPVAAGSAVLTFINHATYLIQLPQMNILTDPIFSERASPISFAGPKRHRPPGIAFENLPTIHVVIISHNHYDHMDLPTIKKLTETHNPLFIVPLGNKIKLEQAGAKNVIELDWWEKTDVKAAQIFLTKAQHWSSRSPFDRNEVLWGAYVIKAEGLNIYFAGDTGYGPHFLETKKRFGPMDLSFIPIGAYEPRWFMKEQHLNPAEALQAHKDLESKQSYGIHFGTFQLTNEAIGRPEEELSEELTKSKISPANFVAPKHGQTNLFKK